MSVSQTILLTTYPYGATPFSAISLRDPDTDAVIDPDGGTYDGTETNTDSGVYAIVRTHADTLLPLGLYRMRCVVGGSPINRYVNLTGVDGEIATARMERAAALDSAARSALLQAMVTEDTGETVAADGSVAKLAQGSASGLTEDQANQLDSIQAHTNLITSGTRVRVTADGGQTIELKIGDDFSAANGTAKRIEVNDADSAIYDALTDETLTAREFGVGIEGSPDLVTGTFEADTITHTPASGSVPAYTTIFVECSVSESLQSITAGYDIQITDSDGRKRTPFSGVCDLVTNYKS